MTGEPQYTIRVKEWKTDAPVPADAFTFKPAADMKKVDSRRYEKSTRSRMARQAKTTGSGGKK